MRFVAGCSTSTSGITASAMHLSWMMPCARLQAHNIEIGSLIDVGASDGFWSKAFAYHFPGRRHLLIDANEIHRPKLIQICQRHTNWRFEIVAVGEAEGIAYFDPSDPLLGHLSEVDHAFWQVDFLFARSDFPLFQERRFFNAERKSIL